MPDQETEAAPERRLLTPDELSPPWTTLGALRKGAVFVTRDGVCAVKSEYTYTSGGQCQCVLLDSGEYAHFYRGNAEEVCEVPHPAALLAHAAALEGLLADMQQDGTAYRLGWAAGAEAMRQAAAKLLEKESEAWASGASPSRAVGRETAERWQSYAVAFDGAAAKVRNLPAQPPG